jgi:hypothetical protein
MIDSLNCDFFYLQINFDGAVHVRASIGGVTGDGIGKEACVEVLKRIFF